MANLQAGKTRGAKKHPVSISNIHICVLQVLNLIWQACEHHEFSAGIFQHRGSALTESERGAGAQ